LVRSFRLAGLLLVLFWSGGVSCKDADPAHDIWKQQFAILEGLLSVSTATDQEVVDAKAFFEGLTGIYVRAEPTAIGWIPSLETEEDLQSLSDWYHENGERLVWDETTKTVQLSG